MVIALKRFVLGPLLFLAFAAGAVSELAADTLYKKGSGTYRWFGIKVYDAVLYAPKSFEVDFYSARPLVLEITYDIDIDRDDLIKTTVEEWEKLDDFRTQRCTVKPAWIESLKVIWPNLVQGDTLRLEALEQSSLFFHNGKKVGQINDSEFAGCFLAIWLAKDTSARGLREDLLNL